VWVGGTPHQGQLQKSWEQTPFCVGCARRVPKRGALRGTGMAVSSSMATAANQRPQSRLSSRAAHACGGEAPCSARCAAKPSSFAAKCGKKPNHQSRAVFPACFLLSPPCDTVNLLGMAWAGSRSCTRHWAQAAVGHLCPAGAALGCCPRGCPSWELVERLGRSLGQGVLSCSHVFSRQSPGPAGWEV